MNTPTSEMLKDHLVTLATLTETDAPVLSLYCRLDGPRAEARQELASWAALAEHSYRGRLRQEFLDAVEQAGELLATLPSARSAAIFARWGDQPFLLALPFQAPLETRFHAGSLPVIYPLVELQDRFDRFVLAVVTSRYARIFEINLGAVSQALLAERPELRRRLGREWTREHYQNHREHRDQQFVREKVDTIRRLMAGRGHNSLVLAGEPRFVKRLREALPRALQDRIAGEIHGGVRDSDLPEVVEKAIAAFVVEEARESHDAVIRLAGAVRGSGLAVFGADRCREAMRRGQADLLVISSHLPLETREGLARTAARTQTPVETVGNSDLLEQHGGAGCILRYLPADPSGVLAA